MPKIYGYARCSLAEQRGQDLHRQTLELKAAGAEEIIEEREHGDAEARYSVRYADDRAAAQKARDEPS